MERERITVKLCTVKASAKFSSKLLHNKNKVQRYADRGDIYPSIVTKTVTDR